MKIKHLKHEEINYKRWDELVETSQNSMIYAFSWFLNCVSPQWEALVDENFQYIMPLPVKKKYGITYIVQPILCQQLGVFSQYKITADVMQKFIQSIPYLSYEMNINEHNFTENTLKLPNLLLDLNIAYENLLKKFSTNTQRNIKKAENHRLKVNWDLSTEEFTTFFFNEEKKYGLPDKNKTKTLIYNAFEKKSVLLIGAKTVEGKLIAALGLFISKNRLIYLLPSSAQEGKEKSAMFFVVNEVIKKFANTDKILDFEGSRMEGVARFYEGFGAKRVSYYLIKRFRPKLLIGR